MPERNILGKIKEKIATHVAIGRNQKFGIDKSYIFIENGSPDKWKESIKIWGPAVRLALRPIIAEALKRDVNERTEFVRSLCEDNNLTIIIGSESNKQLNAIYAETQVKININSMSDENIRNLAEALEIDIEVD